MVRNQDKSRFPDRFSKRAVRANFPETEWLDQKRHGAKIISSLFEKKQRSRVRILPTRKFYRKIK
jgi:hypothetical protein